MAASDRSHQSVRASIISDTPVPARHSDCTHRANPLGSERSKAGRTERPALRRNSVQSSRRSARR